MKREAHGVFAAVSSVWLTQISCFACALLQEKHFHPQSLEVQIHTCWDCECAFHVLREYKKRLREIV